MLKDLRKSTKVSITLNTQTRNNYYSFLAIKGYFILDNQQLKKKLLNIILIYRQYTGFSIAKEVFQILILIGTLKRLLRITYNNTSNNSTLLQSLQSKLKEEGYLQKAIENTVSYLAYIINLVVQDIIVYLKLISTKEDKLSKLF